MLLGVRVGNSGVMGVERRYHISHDELSRLNDIPLDEVQEGMLLIVEIQDEQQYTVHPFETIESIAEKFGVSAESIRSYNHIDRVFVGDKIYIDKKK